jgi:hypothetical protein
MAHRWVDNISIENARIIFRNFAGKKTIYNREGDQNFCVVIDDPQQAQALTDDGWNVHISAPREPGQEVRYYIQVAVNFNRIPPEVYSITNRKKVQLNGETIKNLDFAEIRNVDLTIRPRFWEDDDGTERIKAYLKEMYVTIVEDKFASKYADLDGPDPEEEPF